MLIVNDGSKDGTLSVANKWAAEFPQSVKVIDKENGGHGSTINRGVSQCCGKYFKVLDADDFVETEELDKLVEILRDCDADCIICNYSEVYEAESKTCLKDVTGKLPMGVEMPVEEYISKYRLAMHSITYKTDVYRQAKIELTEKCFYVDTQYIYYPLSVISSIVCYPYDVYRYRLQREGQSVSREGFLKHIDDHRKVMTALCDFYEKFSSEKPELKSFLCRELGMHIAYQQSFLINPSLTKEEWKGFTDFIKAIKKEHRAIYKSVPFKRRFICRLSVGAVRTVAKIM